MLAATETPFTNVVLYSAEEMDALKEAAALLFGQLPLLEIDGLNLTQSRSVVRYLARKHNMCGTNAEEAAMIDMISECARDFQDGPLRFAFAENKEEHATVAMAAQAAKICPRLEALAAANQAKHGVPWIASATVSYADVMLAEVLRSYTQICPQNIASYPALLRLRDAVMALPGVAAYLASDLSFPVPDAKYCENVNTVLRR